VDLNLIGLDDYGLSAQVRVGSPKPMDAFLRCNGDVSNLTLAIAGHILDSPQDSLHHPMAYTPRSQLPKNLYGAHRPSEMPIFRSWPLLSFVP
jgi:hypothetical protein